MLVICPTSSADPFFPVRKAREMLRQFGGSTEFVEIPGARLFVHEDHPDAFAAEASAFLSRCAW